MKRSIFDRQFIAGSLSFIVLAGILAYALVFHQSPATPLEATAAVDKTPTAATQAPISTPTEDPKAEFRTILNDTMTQISDQETVDANLLAELHGGSYSFEKPLVVVNPYNISPLTALVLFTSVEPLNIAIHVAGVDALTDIDFTFDGFNTEHILPVYGLYADQSNKVTLTAIDQSGKTTQSILEIQTEPLPKMLSGEVILTDLPIKDQYQPGLNFTYNNGGILSKTAYDAYGKFRWFLLPEYNYSGGLYQGRFIFDLGSSVKNSVILIETNPLGRIYKVFYSPYGVHHDIEAYKENLLVTGTNGQSRFDFMYELNPQTGKIVNTLDLKTVFQRSRQANFVPLDSNDWFHQNAIEWIEGTNDMLISGRSQSVVARISWPEGEIKWILAPHNAWLPMFQRYLLTPVGDDFEWAYNQHAPEILPDQDNNPDTMDILLFDNGNQRLTEDAELQRKIANNEIVAPELYSRMVQYRINEKDKTVTQIWQFGKELGQTLYSPARGDADLLLNGNRLGFFDVQPDPVKDKSNSANVIEVNAQSEIVWEAVANSSQANSSLMEYRVIRKEIYTGEANNLEIGSPVLNFIPEEIFENYGVAH